MRTLRREQYSCPLARIWKSCPQCLHIAEAFGFALRLPAAARRFSLRLAYFRWLSSLQAREQ